MRQILIVDDEKFIRVGMRSILERFRPGSYNVTESKNGQEAIELIESQEFDIVITDIRMPKLNGLEFAKQISKRFKSIKVIILSGYNDFNYAIESMKYGVKGYLLKPVECVKMLELLDDIEKDLLQEENNSKTIKEYSKNQIKYILLKENIEYQEIEKIVSHMKMRIFENPYYVAVIHGKSKYCENFKKSFDDFYHEGLEISFYDYKGDLVLICHYKICLQKFMYEILEEQIGINIGVSEISQDKNDIKRLYSQAGEASEFAYIKSDSKIVSYMDIKKRPIEISGYNKLVMLLIQKLESNDFGDIEQMIAEIFDRDKILASQISLFHSLIEMINKDIFEYLKNKIPQMFNKLILKYERISDYRQFDNLDTYIDEFVDFMREVNKYIKDMKLRMSNGKDIDVAIDYIKDNYFRDINMAMVSNYVSLNYTYFSQLFKEQTGMNFVDYLKQIRVEKAKKLLKETDLKVYEIAEKVGFQNPKHFMKTFKIMLDMSPSEFRSKAL